MLKAEHSNRKENRKKAEREEGARRKDEIVESLQLEMGVARGRREKG